MKSQTLVGKQSQMSWDAVWMQDNFLKLNWSFTGRSQILRAFIEIAKMFLLVLMVYILSLHLVGVLFDPSLNIELHTKSLTKTAFLHLLNIARFLPVSD